MLRSYIAAENGLLPLPEGADLADAIWIDLYDPTAEEIARIKAFGIDVPTLEDMEEIEISSRLYVEGRAAYMIAVVPGPVADGASVSLPVAFILNTKRLVTVRHHEPRPFATYPLRAGTSSCGTATAAAVFIGLVDEIVGRMADLLETVGKGLDGLSSEVLGEAELENTALRDALVRTGRSAELISRVRLCLLTVERMLAFYSALDGDHMMTPRLQQIVGSAQRDIHALEVHSDFLDSRITLAVDSTLGMINLRQNQTVKILSVVAALFLPPTLIASVYGMNFEFMPELKELYGYPLSLLLMVGSALATFFILRWKKWL